MLNRISIVQECDATAVERGTNADYMNKKLLLLVGFMFVYLVAFTQNYPKQIVVAKDGSGNYTTIQAAVDALRAYSPQHNVVMIKNGVYHEKVTIPAWVTNVTFKGENKDSTVVVWEDFSGKFLNADTIMSKRKMTTFNSYTLNVQGNDVTIENLTIKNAAGRVGQAVALHVDGDRFCMYNCNILGNQDTLLVANDGSRQYYIRCFIEGTTDFIFGGATAIFDACTIHCLSNSYITAASTSAWQKFGFVFLNCKITANNECKKEFLGRPWRAFAKVVFMNCDLGNHILPEGWHNWNNAENESTAFFAEYNNTGEGAKTNKRVKWSYQLSDKQARKYTIQQIFKSWIPVYNQFI